GNGQHGDADAVAAGEFLEVVDVEDWHAPARLLANFRALVVEERQDFESFLSEARVVGQREPEVAGADDGDPQLAIEAQNLAQMALQIADVVADAADTELAEIREILANLRGVQVELLGEGLGGNRTDAVAFELVETPQVHGEAVGGELGDLVDLRPDFQL